MLSEVVVTFAFEAQTAYACVYVPVEPVAQTKPSFIVVLKPLNNHPVEGKIA